MYVDRGAVSGFFYPQTELGWYRELTRPYIRGGFFYIPEKREMYMESKQAIVNLESEKLKMNGADVLIQALKQEGAEILFGYPGGAVLGIYDALYRSPIKHVLARHDDESRS